MQLADIHGPYPGLSESGRVLRVAYRTASQIVSPPLPDLVAPLGSSFLSPQRNLKERSSVCVCEL